MLKMSHAALIAISGLVWFAVGCFLLPLGLNFLVASLLKENLATLSHPLLDLLAPIAGGVEPAALILIVLGLLIGFFKARYIFSKTVDKSVERILSMPNPTSLTKIYTMKYYILLGSMAFIGFVVKLAPLDVRGLVDVTVGAALINGAMLYFRAAFNAYRHSQVTA